MSSSEVHKEPTEKPAEPIPAPSEPIKQFILPVDRISEGKQFAQTVTCAICKGVLWNAVLCSECLEAYCSECINKHKQNSSGLCLCGKEFKERALNKRLQDMLTALKFSCKNSACTEQIPYEKVKEHDQSCPCEKIKCNNSACSMMIERKDMENHLKNECQFQTDPCENCKTPIQRQDKNKHELICPLRQVQCPHCKAKFVFEYSAQHTEVCPMVPVPCKTCLLNVVRSELPSHNCFTALRKELNSFKPPEQNPLDPAALGHAANLSLKKITDKMDLVICPECKRLSQRGCLYKCTMCSAAACVNNCLEYCRKCKKTICSACTRTCVNCNSPLCSICRKIGDHCNILHFFNFEMSDGAYIYLYDIKTPMIKRQKLTNYPNASSELLDSILIDHIVYLCGGKKAKSDVYVSTTYSVIINPLDLSISQKELANLNIARSMHRLIGSNIKQIYCIGGKNNKGILKECEVYHIKKNYWSFIANLNEARACPTVLALGKFIYAFGGVNSHTNAIEEYSMDANMWNFIKIEEANGWMHRGRGIGISLEESNSNILVFEDDGNLYKWNKSESKMLTHSSSKAQCLFVQCKPVVFSGGIYLFDQNDMQTQVVVYLLNNQTWKLVPDWGKLCA